MKKTDIIILSNDKYKYIILDVKKIINEYNNVKINDMFIIIAKIVENIDKLNLSGNDKFQLVCEILYLLLKEKQSELYNLLNLDEDNRDFLLLVSENFIECIIKISKNSFIKNNKDNIQLDVESVVIKIYNQIIKIINKDYDNIKDKVAVYFGIIMAIMGIIESESYLSGNQKKEITINIINKLIDDKIIVEDEDTSKLIKNMVNITPDFIDIIINVSNKKLTINEVIENVDIVEVTNCICGLINFYKKKK